MPADWSEDDSDQSEESEDDLPFDKKRRKVNDDAIFTAAEEVGR